MQTERSCRYANIRIYYEYNVLRFLRVNCDISNAIKNYAESLPEIEQDNYALDIETLFNGTVTEHFENNITLNEANNISDELDRMECNHSVLSYGSRGRR